MMRIAAVVPAYDAEQTIVSVIEDIKASWPPDSTILVVNDGSHDATGRLAESAGATVLSHSKNIGKGAAIRTALAFAKKQGFDAIVTLDADAQHSASQALRLATWECDVATLVLGVRNLVADGAPRANRISNGISNFFLSLFMRKRLTDTQCGLRRYPVQATIDLRAMDNGFAFEAEVLMKALRAGMHVEQVPVRVVYPAVRKSHFHVVRDPARIIARVLKTMAS